MVNVNGVTKHISGDCITVDRASKQEDVSRSGEDDNSTELESLHHDEDDVMSVASEESTITV